MAIQELNALSATMLVAVMLLIGVGLVLMGLHYRALRELRRGAERFAAGDLSQEVRIGGVLPLKDLAASLNRMAKQMQDRYQAAVQQGYEMEAVLSSMVEGVIVVDPHHRVISVNAAAGRLLGIEPTEAAGRSIEAVAPNTGLQRLIRGALQTDEAVQDDLVLQVPGSKGAVERYLQVQSGPLRDAKDQRMGVVVVLHDVSELRRLEGVRRDFVANVSHEIKTPVTTIKGCAETLLDIPDHSPEDTDRFLKIIARQADRLHAIVTDLLTLSRVEQNFQDRRMELKPVKVAEVLKVATESCQFRAEDRQIRIDTDCDAGLKAPINAPLLEQALINLIDNAIKYSPEGSTIRVAAEVRGEELVVGVSDEGCGIEPEHVSRVFERFYRTDRARSRELGGTGLGLAIVKHVAQIHGGRAEVESVVGQGSTFRVHLPREMAAAQVEGTKAGRESWA